MRRLTWTMTLALLAASPAGMANAADEIAALGDAIGDTRIACTRAPSTVCANRVTALLDVDGDGRIVRAELGETRRQVLAEVQQAESGLSETDRGTVAIAIAAIDQVGLDAVFTGFDANGDGGIDRAELFADFRLDQRPFAAIVADPAAVDWPRFADRFGETGRLFLPFLLNANR